MKRLVLFSIFAISFTANAQNSIELALVKKINQFRVENGLDTAEYSAKLSKASRHHAKWMSLTGLLTHDETIEVKGVKRIEKLVDRFIEYGCWEDTLKGSNENAFFSIGMDTKDRIVEQTFFHWKNSPAHRENMLARISPGREKFIKRLIGISAVKVAKKDGLGLNQWAIVMNMGVTFR